MNLDISQCKNCWKWGYTTILYCAYESKYIKCNGLHKVEHHQHFAWCCKANFKMNPPKLKTKQREPCSHSFKYTNYKSDHQADSNICLF